MCFCLLEQLHVLVLVSSATLYSVAGVEAGQWGLYKPVGSVRSKTACACARVNFSHIHFYTNFAAKITANRLVSTLWKPRRAISFDSATCNPHLAFRKVNFYNYNTVSVQLL